MYIIANIHKHKKKHMERHENFFALFLLLFHCLMPKSITSKYFEKTYLFRLLAGIFRLPIVFWKELWLI